MGHPAWYRPAPRCIGAGHFLLFVCVFNFVGLNHDAALRSLLGEELHHIDTVQLRIDAHERMAHLLNDVEISPTNYMLAYLRQRGWTLPNETLTLPNVLPEVERTDIDAEKQVWRIAFFSRLEERKGIKLFVDAVNLLDTAKFPRFEVGGIKFHACFSLLLLDLLQQAGQGREGDLAERISCSVCPVLPDAAMLHLIHSQRSSEASSLWHSCPCAPTPQNVSTGFHHRR